tara:strand:- start:23210 stop:26158 length:2949 start_codon:yes stop_codon:yes gene_type:complete
MIRTLLISYFLFVSLFAFTQKYSFVTYSTEEGLPQSQVTAIGQDDKGYLWIGTLGGLAKFNGSSFTTFSSNEGLLNNRIKALSIIDDTLWIGHDGGISILKNDSVKIIEFSGDGNDKSREVSKIIRFKNQLFVCSNGGGLFIKKKDKLLKVQLDNSDFERIRDAVIYKNQLYLATRGGMLVSSNGQDFNRLSEFGNNSFSGVCFKNDRMVFTTYREGVFIKNLKSGKTRHIASSSLIHSIYGCYIDNDEIIWLNTLNGIAQIHQSDSLSFIDEANGLPFNMISTFFHDSEGNFWIGSQGKGLFRYPGIDFRYFDQSTGFPSDLFLTGFQDKQGDFYFGTMDKGIVKKSSSGRIETIETSESTIWTSLYNVDGRNWFGTERSLIEIHKSGKVVEHFMGENPEIPGSKITALYKISDTRMYIGGNRGVAEYKNGEFKRIGKKGEEIGTVRDFELVDNQLYCVTNLGLMILIKDRFQRVLDIDQVVYNLEKDENGTLWYGTEEGLFQLKKGMIKQVKLLSDPASNFIDFMNYKNGKLFVGTNNGLFILSNLSLEEVDITRYGISDGVLDLETNLNSGFFDNNNSFWFGTASGLVCYHISDFVKKKPKPKISLISILLNYETFNYETYSSGINEIGLPEELKLPYSKNNLTFEMDGISLVYHKGISFQFWMEGLRDSWSSISRNSTISFSSLPAGDYTLHLRSVDIEGRMSNEITFPFTINAAFYNTWWFFLLVILVAAGLTYAFLLFRLKRVAESNEKDKLRYKSRLLTLEQQSMNASMNRHFIFNSLNSIQYFINTQDRFSANKYLTSFAKLIRKNLDSATSSENVISLEDELERIQLYLSLESMRFKDRFDYEINVKNVDTESEFIPAMIMQPFIENSIIHGILPNENKKGHIRINIEIIDDYIEILIEDNGIGINKSLSQKTRMEGDHKSQGMEITSKRIELIHKISDNDISLVGPEEMVDNNRLINGTRVLIKIPCDNLVD